MMVTYTFITFLGMLITSGSCLKSTADLAGTGNRMIPSNQNFYTSTSSLEDLVDAKCKQYTAGLQDQVNELKAKVDRLEVHKSDQNTRDDPSTKATGIPTSCQDLQQLGHSLNGLYLIKQSLPNNRRMKVQTVYCDFQSPIASYFNVEQEIVGTVDIKTKIVHFYAQRKSVFKTSNAVIPFEMAPVNEGNAFNLTSGVFTAPVNGIYYFQFSGVKQEGSKYLEVRLQVNGAIVSSSFSYQPNNLWGSEVISFSASLRLVVGDKVSLYNGDNSVLYDHVHHKTHFTGWLVEEDLM